MISSSGSIGLATTRFNFHESLLVVLIICTILVGNTVVVIQQLKSTAPVILQY